MNYDLNRFLNAQKQDYEQALREMKNGRKRSHWIWYIFPQIKGLGFSSTSQYYGLEGLEEAKAYLSDPVLKGRLLEISEVLLTLPDSNPTAVMGYPDDLKLRSSMTLFAEAAPEIPVFQAVLDKYYHGEKDEGTLRLLGK